MRKGQITWYLIIGLLLLIAAYLFAGHQERLSPKTAYTGEPAEIGLQPALDTCVSNALLDALYEYGRGGRIGSPDSTLVEEDHIYYYVADGVDNIPSLSALQERLGKIVAEYFYACALDVGSHGNIKMAEDASNVDIILGDNSVSAVIDWDVTYESGTKSTKLSHFSGKQYNELKSMYETALKIAGKTMEDSENIDMTYLLELPYEISVVPITNSSYAYILTDHHHEIRSEPYQFVFGVKIAEATQ